MSAGRIYVVQQGDHLDKIAHRAGVSPGDVWNHPANASLRAKRKPSILLPGDVLTLPERPDAALPLDAGSTNAYAARVPTIRVHLRFGGEKGLLADEPFVIRGAGAETKGTTDGDGKLQVSVPVTTRELVIVFPRKGRVAAVRVGDLDPVEEVSGVVQRLENLGLYREASEGGNRLDEDERAAATAEAIEVFQRLAGLEPTGVVDDATRQELVAKHGS